MNGQQKYSEWGVKVHTMRLAFLIPSSFYTIIKLPLSVLEPNVITLNLITIDILPRPPSMI